LKGEEYRESNGCTLEYAGHVSAAQKASVTKHFAQTCALQWQEKLKREKGS